MSISILIFYMIGAAFHSMEYVPSAPETSKVPMAPMGDSCFARCLQGGGVFVAVVGTVTISSCTIMGNTAQAVRVLMFKISHGPMGKLLMCLPRLTLAQLQTTLWSTFQEVRATETLKTSHRPHGRLTVCSLLAGRRCHRLGRHSDHRIVHHQWEHSYRSARSCSKVPIAPMRDLRFANVLLVVCRVAVSSSGVAQ
jgi:hypothetical protein